MHPRANTSSASSSWMPVFDAHYHSHHDGQNMLPGWNSDEADALMNTQHAAGSVDASPLPSPTPPTSDIYSFDQWTAFLSAGQYSNAYASRFLEASNSSPSSNCGFQDSELSSCYPTPPSSITSPLGDDVSPYLTSPDQILRGSYSPFSVNAMGGLEHVTPAQPLQYSTSPAYKPADEPCATSSGHPLLPLVPLPGELTTSGMPSITTNNAGTLSRSYFADATVNTTALGLYYPDMTLCLDAPPLSTQVETNASVPSGPEPLPPSVPSVPAAPLPPVKWTFRAVDPSPKALSSKRTRWDKIRPSPSDASSVDDFPHDDTDIDAGAAEGDLIKCEECGYTQSKRRMGDFRRHLKKHDSGHQTRVICCGVPPTHSAVAGLRPGLHHSPNWYGNRPFYGGCGRSYSRMDALQRHLKKSHCLGGSTKDHQAWRRFYFSHQKCSPH